MLIKTKAPTQSDERGVAMVECVILIALIAITCISAVDATGRAIKAQMRQTAEAVAGAGDIDH